MLELRTLDSLHFLLPVHTPYWRQFGLKMISKNKDNKNRPKSLRHSGDVRIVTGLHLWRREVVRVCNVYEGGTKKRNGVGLDMDDTTCTDEWVVLNIKRRGDPHRVLNKTGQLHLFSWILNHTLTDWRENTGTTIRRQSFRFIRPYHSTVILPPLEGHLNGSGCRMKHTQSLLEKVTQFGDLYNHDKQWSRFWLIRQIM